MTWEVWVSFVIVAAAAITTPGPGNLNTLRRAFELGHRAALYSLLGNVMGLAVLGMATGLGLIALLAASPIIWSVFQWVAIGFLIFLALQMMSQGKHPAHETAVIQQTSALRLFSEAFGISVLNPKAVVFYLAIFPLFVDPFGRVHVQAVEIVITCVAISAMSHFLYIALAGWARQYLSMPHRYRAFRVAAALAMLCIALGLLARTLTQQTPL